jgi:flagellar assembly factor FliW
MRAAPPVATPIDTQVGAFDASPDDVVAIPEGLPGFERCRRYVLLSSPELAPLTCLRGLEDSRPSFLAVDPRVVLPDYHCAIAPADRLRLLATDTDPLVWLALIRIDCDRVLVNLRAPVVINPSRMLGLQILAAESPYSTHHRLLLG